jgi:hypothetical protein
VDTGVGHKVGLELRNIDVEGTVESERGSQRRHHLGNQPIKVGVGRALNVKVAAAHIVQGLVIKTEGAVGVLKKRVGGEHVIVGLHNSSGHLRSRGHSEGKLGLTSVIDRKSLQKKRSKTRSGSTSSGVEDHKSLKTSAVVSQLTNSVQHKVNNLLSDCVMATGVVVGGILLAGDHLLGVVQLSVGSCADFVTHTRLQVNQHGTRDVLTSTSLREKGVERVIASTDSLVRRHLSIRLDAVLEAEKLPASVSGLDTSLANMNRKTLTHCCF